MPAAVDLYRPGLVDYGEALAWQQARATAVAAGERSEALIILQHPSVYTRGARSRPEHLLASEDEIRALGARVLDTDRGGDITFHGPGQIVAYPIVDLARRRMGAADYVRALETAIIATLASFGLASIRVPGRPGVWCGGAKIAAIGVRIRRGVSSHGLALNVCPGLRFFDAIVPCGLVGVRVTSMEVELGCDPGMAAVEDALIAALSEILDLDLEPACFRRSEAVLV